MDLTTDNTGDARGGGVGGELQVGEKKRNVLIALKSFIYVLC